MKLGIRTIVVLLLMTLLITPAFAAGSKEDSADDDFIYIALTAPITGDYAEYGGNFKKSVEMGMDLINANGGVLGKELRVVIGDSKGDPKESATLAQKFTSDKRIVAEIGDFTSTSCLAAQPIYKDAGMVQLSPTSSHPDFAKGSDFSFGIIGTQAGEGPFMAQMTKELGFKKVAVLYINNDWGIVTDKYFSGAIEANGIEVVGRDFYFDGEKDFTAVLTKLKDTNPEMLFIASLYTNVVFHPASPKPEVQAFVTEFEKRYSATPNMFAAVAFDAINIMADAIERAGSTDRGAIRDAVAATKNFPSVTGAITFTEVGDVMKEYTRVQVRDGEFAVFLP